MELILLLEHTLPSLLNKDQVLEEAVRKSRGLPCGAHCLCRTHSLGKPNCLNFGKMRKGPGVTGWGFVMGGWGSEGKHRKSVISYDLLP